MTYWPVLNHTVVRLCTILPWFSVMVLSSDLLWLCWSRGRRILVPILFTPLLILCFPFSPTFPVLRYPPSVTLVLRIFLSCVTYLQY